MPNENPAQCGSIKQSRAHPLALLARRASNERTDWPPRTFCCRLSKLYTAPPLHLLANVILAGTGVKRLADASLYVDIDACGRAVGVMDVPAAVLVGKLLFKVFSFCVDM